MDIVISFFAGAFCIGFAFLIYQAHRKIRVERKTEAMLLDAMTPEQIELFNKHGSPAGFAAALIVAVGHGEITWKEAEAANLKYGREWMEAGGFGRGDV